MSVIFIDVCILCRWGAHLQLAKILGIHHSLIALKEPTGNAADKVVYFFLRGNGTHRLKGRDHQLLWNTIMEIRVALGLPFSHCPGYIVVDFLVLIGRAIFIIVHG